MPYSLGMVFNFREPGWFHHLNVGYIYDGAPSELVSSPLSPPEGFLP